MSVEKKIATRQFLLHLLLGVVTVKYLKGLRWLNSGQAQKARDENK